jgi:hypothetical protein
MMSVGLLLPLLRVKLIAAFWLPEIRLAAADGTQTGVALGKSLALVYVNLNSHNIQGGRLNDVTLGLNWHLNLYTRVSWEYIYAHLNRVSVGAGSAEIGGMRFDMDFCFADSAIRGIQRGCPKPCRASVPS